MSEINLFFVVSPYPKTGSTLLVKSIGQHPSCGNLDPGENFILGRMLNGLAWMDKSQALWQIMNKVESGWQERVKEFCLQMINPRSMTASIYGTKFSDFSNLRFLKDLFPQAYFIGIYRDPRDAYSSYAAMEKSRGHYVKTAQQWCERFMNPFGGFGVCDYVVDYANLVHSFDEELKNVFEALKLSPHSIKKEDLKWIFKDFSAQSQNNRTNLDESEPITSKRIGRYKNELSETESKIILQYQEKNREKWIF